MLTNANILATERAHSVDNRPGHGVRPVRFYVVRPGPVLQWEFYSAISRECNEKEAVHHRQPLTCAARSLGGFPLIPLDVDLVDALARLG